MDGEPVFGKYELFPVTIFVSVRNNVWYRISKEQKCYISDDDAQPIKCGDSWGRVYFIDNLILFLVMASLCLI